MYKRVLIFLLGCILIRIILVLIAKNINSDNLKLLGYLALLPGLGFMLIYLTGIRKTGLEMGGKMIWWNNLRPIHSLLYLMFAYNAINKKNNSWIYLLIDVIIGISSFTFNLVR